MQVQWPAISFWPVPAAHGFERSGIMRFFRRVIVLSMLMLLLLSKAEILMAEVPAGRDRDEVIVAYCEDPGFFYKDKDGNYQGYEVEYLYEIAQTAGLKIKFIDAPNYPAIFEMLQSGKADVALGFVKTPERMQHYLFSKQQLGANSDELLVRRGDDRFNYGDVAALGKMRVAAVAGSYVNEHFAEFCSNQSVKPKVTIYDNYDEAYAAVESDREDAVLSGGGVRKGYVAAIHFFPSRFYVAFNKQRDDLKTRFDTAMAAILAQDPLYESKLSDKRFGVKIALLFSRSKRRSLLLRIAISG